MSEPCANNVWGYEILRQWGRELRRNSKELLNRKKLPVPGFYHMFAMIPAATDSNLYTISVHIPPPSGIWMPSGSHHFAWNGVPSNGCGRIAHHLFGDTFYADEFAEKASGVIELLGAMGIDLPSLDKSKPVYRMLTAIHHLAWQGGLSIKVDTFSWDGYKKHDADPLKPKGTLPVYSLLEPDVFLASAHLIDHLLEDQPAQRCAGVSDLIQLLSVARDLVDRPQDKPWDSGWLTLVHKRASMRVLDQCREACAMPVIKTELKDVWSHVHPILAELRTALNALRGLVGHPHVLGNEGPLHGRDDPKMVEAWTNERHRLGYNLNRLCDYAIPPGGGDRKKRKRRTKKHTPTPKQLEAVQMVGECNGNFAETGRKLGKDPKTVRDLYQRGLENASGLASKLTKTNTQLLPKDRRGQALVKSDDEGQGVQTFKQNSRRNVKPEDVTKPARKR